MGLRTIAVVLALVAIGCGPRVRTSGPRGADARAVLRLERLAQSEMRCPEALHVTALDAGAYQLEGCGQSREYAYVCTGRRRCTFQPIVPAVLRASSDLQCPPELLQAAAASPVHRAYFGCSRGAAYLLVCGGRGCTWSRTPETVSVAAPTSVPVVPLYAPTDATLGDVVIPPPPGQAAPTTPPATPASIDGLVVPPPPS